MSGAQRVSTSALALTLAWGANGGAEPRPGPSGPGRDPFAVARRASPPSPSIPAPAADGLEGISIDEIVVRGVLHARERGVAIVQGRGAAHHLVRPGDRLRDGRVHAIDASGLTLVADAGRAPRDGGAGLVRRNVRAPRAIR